MVLWKTVSSNTLASSISQSNKRRAKFVHPFIPFLLHQQYLASLSYTKVFSLFFFTFFCYTSSDHPKMMLILWMLSLLSVLVSSDLIKRDALHLYGSSNSDLPLLQSANFINKPNGKLFKYMSFSITKMS